MNDTITRDFMADAQLVGDGRTIILTAVPYDTPTLVDDGAGPYWEAFREGAFRRVTKAPNRTELRYRHAGGVANLLGRAVTLTETPTALIGEFRAVGPNGDQALAMVRDGLLTGASVGAELHPNGTEIVKRDGREIVTRTLIARLPEVSLVPEGAYSDAGVLAVRERHADTLAAARERARWEWLYANR